MESPEALPSGGLVFQFVCHFHRYWAYSSKSTVWPKMEPVLFPPSVQGLRHLLIPVQGAQIQSLVRQLDPTCCNQRFCMMQLRPGTAKQIISSLKERSIKLKKKKKNLRVPLLFNSLNELKQVICPSLVSVFWKIGLNRISIPESNKSFCGIVFLSELTVVENS